MNKFKQLKEAIKNPPPDRLAKIEYKSHLFQAIGISFVCVVLVLKGFWWIIFAFVFGLGISYSQGMTAYAKYKMIKSLMESEQPEDFEKDISPSRRRSKIVKYTFGNNAWFIAAIFSVCCSLLLIDPTGSRWMLMVQYPMAIFVSFIFFYFFLLYWIANYFYRKDMKVKRRWNNGKKEKRN